MEAQMALLGPGVKEATKSAVAAAQISKTHLLLTSQTPQITKAPPTNKITLGVSAKIKIPQQPRKNRHKVNKVGGTRSTDKGDAFVIP